MVTDLLLLGAILDALQPSPTLRLTLDSEAYWSQYKEVEREPSALSYGGLDALRGGRIVLGFLGRSHLGDTLCTSALPRLLRGKYQCQVHVVRHRSLAATLENNPNVSGFWNEDRLTLGRCLSGSGHIIQKLERYFELPISPFPRPEVYLSADELRWAMRLRAMLPRNKPIALMCTGSLTDSMHGKTDNLAWQLWANVLAQTYTVVQLCVTRVLALESAIQLSDAHLRNFRADTILHNVVVLENLAPRQFLTMFSIADLYMGLNSGGAHAAAAFDVPAIVVLNSAQYGALPVFPDTCGPHKWHNESFLYPYHSFILA